MVFRSLRQYQMIRLSRFALLIAVSVVMGPGVSTGTTLYHTDFVTESGVVAGSWSKGSTSLNGVVDVADLYGYQNFLRMHTKTPQGPSLNYATLELSTSGYSDLRLKFDHFINYDQVDYFSASSYIGLDNADGVAISFQNDEWHPVWSPPHLANLRVGGRFWQYNVEVDIGSLLSSLGANPGQLKIRFQQFDKYERLNADGRGWDNVEVTAVPVPEPTSVVLAISGVAGLLGVRRLRRAKI
jgi:hypothetical protein